MQDIKYDGVIERKMLKKLYKFQFISVQKNTECLDCRQGFVTYLKSNFNVVLIIS